MSTREERDQEARDEAHEHRHCIGCLLGLTHDHDEDDL